MTKLFFWIYFAGSASGINWNTFLAYCLDPKVTDLTEHINSCELIDALALTIRLFENINSQEWHLRKNIFRWKSISKKNGDGIQSSILVESFCCDKQEKKYMK